MKSSNGRTFDPISQKPPATSRTGSLLKDVTSASSPDISPRREQLGPYRLVREIASGGMASVYLGAKRGPGGFEKFVAIKTIHEHLAREPAFAEMFMDEARLTAMVAHPYVCSAIDCGRDGHDLYIAMEFLQGESLGRIGTRQAQDETLASHPRRFAFLARVFANIAEGMQAIHSLKDHTGKELGVVHRDVTPQNLFVLFDGTVRVMDLGIAYAKQKIHNTDRDALKGKLSYMAPEQLNREPVDRRSDIWALGIVMWELLTDYRLFRRASEADTVLAVMHGPIPLPSALNARVPKQLDNIVLKALSRDPNERYQTMAELGVDLERFLETTGENVTNAQIARWMTELFPGGPAKAEQLITQAREALIKADSERPGSGTRAVNSGSLASSETITTTDAAVPQSVDVDFDESTVVTGAHMPANRLLASSATSQRAATPRRRTVAWAIFLAAIGGAAIGFVAAWQLHESPSSAAREARRWLGLSSVRVAATCSSAPDSAPSD